MKHTRPVFACLLVGMLSSTLAAAEPQLADKPFSRSGCSIRFPKDWRTESAAGATAFVFATAPQADAVGGQEQSANINIVRVVLSKPNLMTLAKDHQDRMVKDAAQAYKPVDAPREITINGAKAVTFGGTYTSAGKPLRNRQWLIVGPGRVYIVTLTTLSATWANHLPNAEASVGTFKAIDEKR